MAHVRTPRHYALQDACMGVFRVSKKPQLHAAAETTIKLGPLNSNPKPLSATFGASGKAE